MPSAMQSGTRMLGSSHAISGIMIGERWRCAHPAPTCGPRSPPVRLGWVYKG